MREAAGLAAYRTGRYAEALRELRTVRRLNGSSEHLAIMADCERGLGRPERALALAQEPEAETLDAEAKIELAMVVSGARLDLGQAEAAVAALSTPPCERRPGSSRSGWRRRGRPRWRRPDGPPRRLAELAPYTQDQLDEAAGDVEIEDEVVSFDLSEFDADGEYDEEAPEAVDAVDAADDVRRRRRRRRRDDDDRTVDDADARDVSDDGEPMSTTRDDASDDDAEDGSEATPRRPARRGRRGRGRRRRTRRATSGGGRGGGRSVTGGLVGSQTPLADRFDLALVDLDGVAYRGHEPIDGAAEGLTAARAARHAAGVRHQQRVA